MTIITFRIRGTSARSAIAAGRDRWSWQVTVPRKLQLKAYITLRCHGSSAGSVTIYKTNKSMVHHTPGIVASRAEMPVQVTRYSTSGSAAAIRIHRVRSGWQTPQLPTELSWHPRYSLKGLCQSGRYSPSHEITVKRTGSDEKGKWVGRGRGQWKESHQRVSLWDAKKSRQRWLWHVPHPEGNGVGLPDGALAIDFTIVFGVGAGVMVAFRSATCPDGFRTSLMPSILPSCALEARASPATHNDLYVGQPYRAK
uniref:Uncharacterized protein n=1 Tax=Timema shepardi TaxID=629360 RepID=A0A7R9B732_TIMSH|nr:unnamed protein product [Timema shepardi]